MEGIFLYKLEMKLANDFQKVDTETRRTMAFIQQTKRREVIQRRQYSEVRFNGAKDDSCT